VYGEQSGRGVHVRVGVHPARRKAPGHVHGRLHVRLLLPAAGQCLRAHRGLGAAGRWLRGRQLLHQPNLLKQTKLVSPKTKIDVSNQSTNQMIIKKYDGIKIL